MSMKDVIVMALKPYVGKINAWDDSDIELLFMGFGNISIFWADENPLEAQDMSGSFKENAIAIDSALKELKLHNGKWTYKDFYWVINSNAGEPRTDLIKAIELVGLMCYDYFDAEEFETPESIKTFEEDPLLF
tara:strand:- start:544 stop:942 length:399 start_codon:yes stop_codon:yes gene_type:complete